MVSGGFLEARSDAAELLEFAEAAFDEMALGVEMLVERVFAGARWIAGNDGQRTFVGDGLAEVVGVVGGVGHHDLGRQSFDQRRCLRHIAAMTGGEGKADGTAQAPDREVDFGAQAAP